MPGSASPSGGPICALKDSVTSARAKLFYSRTATGQAGRGRASSRQERRFSLSGLGGSVYLELLPHKLRNVP
eukprot:scaffold84119_cov50-Phaeocystis_antarctica.AAC.3